MTHSPTQRAAQPPPARRRGSSSSTAENAVRNCKNNRHFFVDLLCIYIYIYIFYSPGSIELALFDCRRRVAVCACGGAGPQIRSTIEELQIQKDWIETTQNRCGDDITSFFKNVSLFSINSESLPATPYRSHASFTTLINYSSLLCRPLSLQ